MVEGMVGMGICICGKAGGSITLRQGYPAGGLYIGIGPRGGVTLRQGYPAAVQAGGTVWNTKQLYITSSSELITTSPWKVWEGVVWWRTRVTAVSEG